jgi:outer membrane protein OmpA-like peptidoglycan-associated protein
MLVTIIITISIFFLSLLWVIGFATSTMGSLIRALLVVAFVAVVARLIQNRLSRNEYRQARMLMVLGLSITMACASLSPATDALTDSLAAVRRAEAAGAEALPEADRHLQLARQEITKARALLAKGKNEPAYHQALRANNDAALALTLARKAEQRKLAAAPERAQQLAVEAQRQATRAAAELAGIASIEQHERGVVITLRADSLFANSNDDVLLPRTQAKLERVAEVLHPEAKYVVDALTRRRANTVRDYLITLGVAPERIEIVVERHSASGGLPTRP